MRTQSEASDVVLRHFEPVEQVVVTDGPFANVKAIYQMADSEGRGMAMLNIMSKAVKMSLAPPSISKVR